MLQSKPGRNRTHHRHERTNETRAHRDRPKIIRPRAVHRRLMYNSHSRIWRSHTRQKKRNGLLSSSRIGDGETYSRAITHHVRDSLPMHFFSWYVTKYAGTIIAWYKMGTYGHECDRSDRSKIRTRQGITLMTCPDWCRVHAQGDEQVRLSRASSVICYPHCRQHERVSELLHVQTFLFDWATAAGRAWGAWIPFSDH